jgi:hypothetical protein
VSLSCVHVEDPVSVEQMEGARARGETRTTGDEQNMSERSLIYGRQGRVLGAAPDPRPNIEASGEWESASAALSAFGRHPLPLVLHHPVTTHGRHSVQLPASDSQCPRAPLSLNSRSPLGSTPTTTLHDVSDQRHDDHTSDVPRARDAHNAHVPYRPHFASVTRHASRARFVAVLACVCLPS